MYAHIGEIILLAIYLSNTDRRFTDEFVPLRDNQISNQIASVWIFHAGTSTHHFGRYVTRVPLFIKKNKTIITVTTTFKLKTRKPLVTVAY